MPVKTESPFAHNRCYLLWCSVQRYIRARYHSFITHTGSCARPKSSLWLHFPLFQKVFAGCR